MLTLPEPIMTLLTPFRPIFHQATWCKGQILFIGAILATGKRTVTAALRVMGLSDESGFWDGSANCEIDGVICKHLPQQDSKSTRLADAIHRPK